MRYKIIDQAGWGGWPCVKGPAFRPERQGEVVRSIQKGGSWLARGAGRSYGDQAQNSKGFTMLTERLDRLLTFDEASGVLVAEPGVRFSTLLQVFLPRGWLAPVSPGTGFATLGGALANDVHGKNHDRDGSFGDHLLWFDLLLASGEIQRVRFEEHPDLFCATLGGCGLTGIVTALCLRMTRAPGNSFAVRENRISDLDRFLDSLLSARAEASYSVGWIDALAKGRHLGRGILERAELADCKLTPVRERKIQLPFDFPAFALNRWSVACFNALYARKAPKEGRERLVPCGAFLYPLDAIGRWNRLYGKRGFHQFQCVLPEDQAARGLPLLLEQVARSRLGSFLAVLKSLGRAGRGYLSFPMPGFTLALDFPHRPACLDLVQQLEKLTLDHGGRVYLAKDSTLRASMLEAMYPKLTEFRAVLRAQSGPARFRSDMARRLALGDESW